MSAGFYQPQLDAPALKRFFLYGAPKSVKTPLALAYGAYLRSKNPLSRTLYIAADTGSEDLPSIPNPAWHEWIDVWRFGSPLEVDANGKSTYDPYRDTIQVAMTDWKAKDPNIELIIWDTFSISMENVLQFCADKEFFSSLKGADKHITFGDPTLPKGHPGRMNIPLPGDYNGANGIAKRLVNLLCSQKTHVMCICHEQEIKEKGITRIGPSFVGSALTGKLPGWMTGLIYTEKRGEIDQKTGKVIPTLYVCSDPADDFHIAGVRHAPINGDPRNPIGVVKVGSDLTAYWNKFHETLFPNEVHSTTGAK